MSGIIGTSHSKSKVIGRTNDIVKSWVNFSASASIRDSFNCSSITDNGVGDFSVNFLQNMPNNNYSVVTGNRWDDHVSGTYYGYRYAGYFRVKTRISGGTTATDPDTIDAIVFGD